MTKFSFFKVLPITMRLMGSLAEAAEDGEIDENEIMDIITALVRDLGLKASIKVE